MNLNFSSILKITKKSQKQGTSLWLRLCASTTGGVSSIPGGGTKIPQAQWHGLKKLKDRSQTPFGAHLKCPTRSAHCLLDTLSYFSHSARGTLPPQGFCTVPLSGPVFLQIPTSTRSLLKCHLSAALAYSYYNPTHLQNFLHPFPPLSSASESRLSASPEKDLFIYFWQQWVFIAA